MEAKKKKMTREEALAMYQHLQKSMNNLVAKKKISKEAQAQAKYIADMLKSDAATATGTGAAPTLPQMSEGARPQNQLNGQRLAIGLVVAFACLKISLSALEATGVASAPLAEAALVPQMKMVQPQGDTYTKEEVKVLKSLDARRVELEERSKRIDEREGEIDIREKEFATRLTQLRELTNTLKLEREKGDKKRNTQLEQLANVYGSMNPQEAAALIEQLDVTIGLELLQKMPEKRIGQILGLMRPEKALTITKMLSEKSE